MGRAREWGSDREFLEGYLRSLTSRRRFLEIGRALQQGRVPRWEGRGAGRRLVFEAAPRETSSGSATASQRRRAAAHVILELSPEQAEHTERLLNSASFEDHPQRIRPVRARIRELLGHGLAHPQLWVPARIPG